MLNNIKYLKHDKIHKSKWDRCIESAYHPFIYAYSWYLDITAPGWQALVLGNYDAVMPLPVKSKAGIMYAYQPFFSQQLGVYSKEQKVDISTFLEHLPKEIKFLNFNLNETNTLEKGLLRNNKNFLLDISDNYDPVFAGYNRNCKRNIKKSQQIDLLESKDVLPEQFVAFIESNLEEQIKGIGKKEYALLKKLCIEVVQRGKGEIIALVDGEGKVHAAGLYLFSGNRLIFSVCASSSFGKTNQAMYRLVDSQIKRYAGKFKWYDFSGSNIEGIAYFNSTFGAIQIPYPTVMINKLPWPIKVFKK